MRCLFDLARPVPGFHRVLSFPQNHSSTSVTIRLLAGLEKISAAIPRPSISRMPLPNPPITVLTTLYRLYDLVIGAQNHSNIRTTLPRALFTS
jgi:hypothetical protein